MHVWVDEAGGSQTWDRSVLRLYRQHDASGDEIDLTAHTNEASAYAIGTPAAFERFSFKAIGTKTLSVQTFKLKFKYKLGTDTDWTIVTREIKVSPVTGASAGLTADTASVGGDAALRFAFDYGTPVLDVSVGAARLTVPIGRTADMIGAAYVDARQIGPDGSQITTFNALLPGAGEGTYLPMYKQFELNTAPYNKTDWGTPWPGSLVGYYANNPYYIYGPDGGRYETGNPTDEDRYRVNDVYPHPSSTGRLHYVYDADNRVTEIHDYASPQNNTITLTRAPGTGYVTAIRTSDWRRWTITSDPANGNITGVVPQVTGNIGARYFSWNGPADDGGRVTEVRAGATPGQNVLYAFEY